MEAVNGFRSRRALGAALAVACAAAAVPATAPAATWVDGDVVVGTADTTWLSRGRHVVFANGGQMKETIEQAVRAEGTGCAFDPARNLYTTAFEQSSIVRFGGAHPHPRIGGIYTGATGGVHNASISFARDGSYYVGTADGNGDVLRYRANNTLDRTFDVATEVRGSEFVDLGSDQRTLFYTSQSRRVFRYDAATGTQLAPFATLPGAGTAFAVKVLPPGDGSGGLLVSDWNTIKLLDGAGNLVRTYDQQNEDSWFGLALDTNGRSFWASGIISGRLYRFAIATGAREVGPVLVSALGKAAGVCVRGEPTAGTRPAP